jgi:RimJ/RimL family protein N-acetyltransferase
LGLNRIEAHVAPDNGRSQRVVGKLGFHREGIARGVEFVGGRFIDHIQYSLLRREVLGREEPS